MNNNDLNNNNVAPVEHISVGEKDFSNHKRGMLIAEIITGSITMLAILVLLFYYAFYMHADVGSVGAALGIIVMLLVVFGLLIFMAAPFVLSIIFLSFATASKSPKIKKTAIIFLTVEIVLAIAALIVWVTI